MTPEVYPLHFCGCGLIDFEGFNDLQVFLQCGLDELYYAHMEHMRMMREDHLPYVIADLRRIEKELREEPV